jgi:O-acetyl-ADP-ribose deacetylase (regulator of RNase III)
MDSPATAGTIRKQHITEYGQVLQVVFGDIFADRVDAIVNGDANGQMAFGGSELIKRGGADIQKECTAWVKQNGKLDDVSKCAITTAGNLLAKHVLHSPGIMWYSGKREEERKLRDAVYHCLECAHKYQLKGISFPAMSVTNLYSFPRDKCAHNMLEAVLEWVKFRGRETTISCIQFVTTDEQFINEMTREFVERFKDEDDQVSACSNSNQYEVEEETTEEPESFFEEAEDYQTAALLSKTVHNKLYSKDKRGLKRSSEGSIDMKRKARRTSIDQDAMQLTQMQNDDVMQMTQQDLMMISGASLTVDNTSHDVVDLSISDHDLFK